MGRIKRTNIFNKNHISIVKTENYLQASSYKGYYPYMTYKAIKFDGKNYGSGLGKKITVTERCKSPLGFYYNKTYTTYEYADSKKYDDNSRETHCLTIYIPQKDIMYELTYLYSYKDIKVNKETRPWELADGDITDNMINSLVNDVNKFFDMAKELKIIDTQHQYSYDGCEIYSLQELKRKTFEELFGDPKGPRFMTNEEKILSHGFDLTTSFRKM